MRMPFFIPSVFGRNLQWKPVRGVNIREECHWSHACSLQANMRGNQYPRVEIGRKKEPCPISHSKLSINDQAK
jgi:heterodisulfide reductase subunit A-like polyferredoxin